MIQNMRNEEWVGQYRKENPEADLWAKGYGPIQHTVETQARVFSMAERLAVLGLRGDGVSLFHLLFALDRVTSAAMWVVFTRPTPEMSIWTEGTFCLTTLNQSPKAIRAGPSIWCLLTLDTWRSTPSRAIPGPG
jgi:hypothetical protein